MAESASPGDDERARIDAWLWAARLYKTRSLATAAVRAGHVRVNDAPAKPSRNLQIGDRIEATTPGGLRILIVLALASKRGPAVVARALYEDKSPPPPPRDAFPASILREPGAGRPSKLDRRRLDRLRGRGRDDR